MTFIPNPNLLGELKASVEIRRALEDAAKQTAETARQIAPVGDPAEDDHPGQFRDGIEAQGTEIVATDPASAFIIFGTSHSPPHDTLLRAAEMNGLHVMKES